MNGWQSIESAPKDGTFILIGKWIDVDMSEIEFPTPKWEWWVELVFFEKRNSRGKVGAWTLTSGDYCDDQNDSRRSDYTHWMPLPCAPSKLRVINNAKPSFPPEPHLKMGGVEEVLL